MLAWLPFIISSIGTGIGLIYLSRQSDSLLIKLKCCALLGFIWVLTGICYTPTAYNFSGTEIIHYLVFGPVKLTLVPFQHLDIEFWLNVLLTMPLGFLIIWNFPHWSWRRLIFIGLLTGLTLETGQFILDWLVQINRWVEVDDVLTNWAGVIIGGAFSYWLNRQTWFKW
ncbi:VanZ family protein [Lactiplantibacillus mudanjiangensis]|uniref:VanZ-like domain-containing protein n=1 Tax=Lactiplantibacillus mudanjiangensis TaxID=1296538 RepID=A0A660E2C4_9LACO|nr:VanZ family protein [Lactiplantibacillus mudanjiangensis]VDG23544.1 hypothetical protein [Lactobacillus sp. CBA3605] [Lactiplantibacillus mudanjiangensis]VDG28775.1 hypothetical protein [Lactobacillus sp. CBA3605] [Lactiplantibacillus mudanjiangensis]VDG32206.1 hypothetical protein [Lactobacillus sp. CBA3605] [Lactiplantibacillus mudanjiangensis]